MIFEIEKRLMEYCITWDNVECELGELCFKFVQTFVCCRRRYGELTTID